jgi:hypothetical protein
VKQKAILILPILFLLGSFLGPSCSWVPRIDEYLIRIDSIKHPPQINADTDFIIEFYGTVGTNGCSGFSHFNVDQIGNDIYIEAWKIVKDGAVICPAVMVYLEAEPLTYSISSPGEYQLKIKQPDESFLIENIIVK